MTVSGKEKVGDREAYVIDATPAGAAAEKLYFDTQTGLLIRRDFTAESPQGSFPAQEAYEDYKAVDGVMVAFTTKLTLPQFGLVIKLSEVKHNVPVEDAQFLKPAAK